MKVELTIAGALCASLVTAAPVVSDVTLTQRGSSKILVTYRLDEPAVVTLDVLTNAAGDVWASIGGANVTNVWGDVNKVVRDTEVTHEIWWRPSEEWKANFAQTYTVKAKVKAWATDTPPNYMVVDLMQEADKGGDPVRYFEDPSFFPYGKFAGKADDIDPLYRGRYLVMRKVPAKGTTWRMGSPASELGKSTCESSLRETAHYVTLTSDYYLGAFEVTQEQCARFIGVGSLSSDKANWPCALGGGLTDGLVSYKQFRGATFRWPGDAHQVDSLCAVDKLRMRSGVDFDLPTEAEWEFACRAGTLSALYTGNELNADSGVNDNLNPIAWYVENSGSVRRVGEKEPNGFGLYDMLGNVAEFCLDRQMTDLGTADAVDPAGAETGEYQVLKGGSCQKSAAWLRAASRQNWVKPEDSYYDCGFRLWAPAIAK